MAWIYLSAAILFEVAGTTALKLSEGFSHLFPSLLILPAYAVSFILLTLAVKVIPISVVYAVWSGIGIALITVIGVAWFKEPMSVAKLGFLVLIVVGVSGLHWADTAAGRSAGAI